MRYSIEPRDRIYVKGYGFLSFAKNMGKSLSNKYGQNFLIVLKKVYIKGTYTSNDIKFKTTMLRSNLCDYPDAYILVMGTITITGVGDVDAPKRLDERNKGVTFKNCAPFTKCICRINNTDIDNARDINTVMPMYNLIEYSDNYSKTSGGSWQYYKDDPNDNITQSE